VLAPDLYHGQIATTIDDAERISSALDAKQANRELVAALTTLKTHPASSGEHTGVVGFSLGAYFALWLADEKPADVAAVVLFYGTGAEVTRAKAAFLGHFAEQDSFEPPESVNSLEDQLRAAGRDVTFYTYPGTGHWFFEADVPAAYNAEAAALAWERTVSFLRRSLI
jgi:carboxymethylenebutenolidase